MIIQLKLDYNRLRLEIARQSGAGKIRFAGDQSDILPDFLRLRVGPAKLRFEYTMRRPKILQRGGILPPQIMQTSQIVVQRAKFRVQTPQPLPHHGQCQIKVPNRLIKVLFLRINACQVVIYLHGFGMPFPVGLLENMQRPKIILNRLI